MNFKQITFMLLLALVAFPSCAQNKGKNLAKALDAAVGRQALTRTLPKRAPGYHPVFGYRPFTFQNIKKYHLATIFGPKAESWSSLQVAPVLQADPASFEKDLAGFMRIDKLRPGQVVQAVYLWRLANPRESMRSKFFILFQKAYHLMKHIQEHADKNEIPGMAEDYPAVKLLKYLLREKSRPLSYAQMLAHTTQYPKHVVLNGDNFPVFTAQAQRAEQLDAYLMLSNPQEMGPFNNLNGWQEYRSPKHRSYYKFVLTPEEKQAANALVALRQQAYQIAQAPTSRELIELIYNELESHALPYSQLKEGTIEYDVYPNYKDTALYIAVQHKLEKLKAQGLMQGDPEFANYVHLVVLNAMMGGVSLRNCKRLNEVLWAFKELCGLTKNTEFNIAHLTHLQQALQSTVGIWAYADMPFVMMELQKSNPYVPMEKLEELRYWMHELLKKQDVRHLVGKNLK